MIGLTAIRALGCTRSMLWYATQPIAKASEILEIQKTGNDLEKMVH